MSLLRRAPWYVVPLGIFLLTRVLAVVLVVLVARDQVPASQITGYQPMPTLVDPATYWHVIANWDGQWYRHIAAHGYPGHLPYRHGVVEQNAWAFYPLFPAVVALVMLPGLSFGAAATVVSVVAGAVALCLLYRMLDRRAGRFTAALTALAVCSAPAAPILQAAYSESLALVLLLAALRSLQERRYAALALAGVALSLTRAVAPPLALVVGWEYLRRRRTGPDFPLAERRSLLLSGGVVALSSLLWPVVVGVVTGDVRAYWRTQTAWATVAGNNADTWLTSLPHNPGRAVVVVVGLGLLALVCLRARSWPHVLRMWPVPYAVFVLAVTPATASVLRFSMLLGAPWWPAPGWSGRLTSPGARAAVLVSVLVVGLAVQWWWLRTYFVIDPYSHGHP